MMKYEQARQQEYSTANPDSDARMVFVDRSRKFRVDQLLTVWATEIGVEATITRAAHDIHTIIKLVSEIFASALIVSDLASISRAVGSSGDYIAFAREIMMHISAQNISASEANLVPWVDTPDFVVENFRFNVINFTNVYINAPRPAGHKHPVRTVSNAITHVLNGFRTSLLNQCTVNFAGDVKKYLKYLLRRSGHNLSRSRFNLLWRHYRRQVDTYWAESDPAGLQPPTALMQNLIPWLVDETRPWLFKPDGSMWNLLSNATFNQESCWVQCFGLRRALLEQAEYWRSQGEMSKTFSLSPNIRYSPRSIFLDEQGTMTLGRLHNAINNTQIDVASSFTFESVFRCDLVLCVDPDSQVITDGPPWRQHHARGVYVNGLDASMLVRVQTFLPKNAASAKALPGWTLDVQANLSDDVIVIGMDPNIPGSNFAGGSVGSLLNREDQFEPKGGSKPQFKFAITVAELSHRSRLRWARRRRESWAATRRGDDEQTVLELQSSIQSRSTIDRGQVTAAFESVIGVMHKILEEYRAPSCPILHDARHCFVARQRAYHWACRSVSAVGQRNRAESSRDLKVVKYSRRQLKLIDKSQAKNGLSGRQAKTIARRLRKGLRPFVVDAGPPTGIPVLFSGNPQFTHVDFFRGQTMAGSLLLQNLAGYGYLWQPTNEADRSEHRWIADGLIQVDEHRTSAQCVVCYINRNHRTQSGEVRHVNGSWRLKFCTVCETLQHRDWTAAHAILLKGMSLVVRQREIGPPPIPRDIEYPVEYRHL